VLATATLNDWGAICFAEGQFYQAATRENLEILDRIGGGDSFASGLIYGFLTGRDRNGQSIAAPRTVRGNDHSGRHDDGNTERS
jgi:sugar/nucleoside kinase (ribokinase family)